jgi:hypothetical protein
MSTDSVLDTPPGNRPAKRRNFLPDNSVPLDQSTGPVREPALSVSPATDLPPTTAETPSARRKTSAPEATATDIKPARRKKEPAAKRVPWAFRILPDIIEDWDAYMSTLPRHVSQQDVMEYVMRDFLKRRPKLPDSLLAPPSR